ncbi:hypothetical protein RchiOBHm_Chr5g0042741 [Rosa chinensis]|uniref:Uncharacterized protein n=1 Tax=Rosa chinensis TaxID=74649 RepID=A0A2P6QD59_ROSCH|nr:hypothetical protein RchiOBHm_Chr5g0042741 [Rosa chinensis]
MRAPALHPGWFSNRPINSAWVSRFVDVWNTKKTIEVSKFMFIAITCSAHVS